MDSTQHNQAAAEEASAKTEVTHADPAAESTQPPANETAAETTIHTRKHEEAGHPPPIETVAQYILVNKSQERRHTHATHRRRDGHTERATGFIAYPLGIALFTAWLLTVFAAFSFDVVLDVFQRYLLLRDPPAIPWMLLVCSDAGIHLFLTLVVVLLGRLTKRRFRFFQPFVGGDAFVVLQFVGYNCVYVTVVVRAVLLSQRQERYGAYAVLGAFEVVGHCLLLWSLSFFQSPPPPNASQPPASLSASMARGWRVRLANSLQREVAWIVLCCGVVVVSSVVAEYHSLYRFINVLVVTCFVLASLLTIQHVIVPQWLGRHFYHVLLPVVFQSPTMYVLQVFANGLLFMTFYAELVLFNAKEDAPPSWHLCCGLMAVMAIGAHLLLVHQLHTWVEEEEEAAEDAAAKRRADSVLSSAREANEHEEATSVPSHLPSAAAATIPPRRVSRNKEGYKNEMGSYGPVLPSLFSVVLCAILIGILYVSFTSGERMSPYVRQGLLQTEALLVTLLFVQPLITHLMGVFLYGKAYRIWQPFEGNLDFILLQCVGWFCYGLAIFFAPLHLNERGHDNFLLLLMAFLVLSQFLIHISVVRFGRGSAAPPTVDTAPVATAEASGGHAEANRTATEAARTDEDALSSNRAASRSPARSDATSEGASGPQPSPFWGRGADDAAENALSSTDAAGEEKDEAAGAPHGAGLLSSVVNGELLLSMVLMGVSLVMRVVVIAAAYIQHVNAERDVIGGQVGTGAHETKSALTSARLSTAQIPMTAVTVAATLFSVTATPVVQWSMRRRVQLFKPLSYAYAVLATLGWGAFLLLLSRFLVLWGLLGLERVSVTSPITRVGLSCFLPSSEFSSWLRQACDAATVDAQGSYATTGEGLTLTAAFEGAVEGFVWCFPFLCLLAGNLFQTHAFLREAAAQERVQRAVESVLKLFEVQRGAVGSPSDPATLTSPLSPSTQGRNAQLGRLLRTIAGPRVAAASATAEFDNASMTSENVHNSSSADLEDLRAVHDAARYMTFTLCAATSAAFLSAAFLADAQPIMTLGFGAVGTATLGLSCVALHYVYGTRVHKGTRSLDASAASPRVPVYTFFMPFVGGTKFVVLQSVGWISFTCVASFMIACALEGKGTAVIFLVMTVLSIAAQATLWRSVGCFDESKVLERGFLQRNAEGFLAALSVVATVSFCRLYDMAEQGRATAHVATSMVPVVVCSIAVCFAVPLGLLSLQRQAELYGLGSFAAWLANEDDDNDAAVDDDDNNNDDQPELETGVEDTSERTAEGGGALPRAASSRLHSRGPSAGMGASSSTVGSPASGEDGVSSPGLPHSIYSRSNTETSFSPLLGTPGVVRRRVWSTLTRRSGSGTRRRSLAAVVFYLLSTVLAMLIIVVLPFALVFMGYAYYTQRATVTYGLAVRAVEALLCCFTALVVLPIIVVPVLGRSSTLRNVHSAFCCWALYNIPTYTFLGGISTPFLYNCRGTHLFTINMCSMALLSNLPYMPIAMSIFSVCSFVYFLKYHFYDGLYTHKHELAPVQCVVDFAIAIFWLCYQRRYHGRPEITGRLESRRATRFFQQYFFRGFVYYFSMRVIVGDGYVLPQEEPYVSDRSEVPRVDLSNPKNQYMFSFHPHGVFPGTSMVVPKTEIWEKAVGRCKEHFVSTHCADIVFNVPLMRDFPMCLGAMSVSRRGIESSLKHGNSPLIVTGGQSEMLLTRMSDNEMHVVCHHIGFIRMAIKNGVPLVPVISFSESNILDNVHCIRLQRWFLNRIAFPFPTLPIGRWYLPLPTTKPVTIVVGQPISPLPGRDNADDPAHVEELRLRYFEHLEVLFYKYRAKAGYPAMELYLHNGIYNPGVRSTPSVTTPLLSGTTQRQDKADLSVEMFDSAVRRAFSMSPDEKAGARAMTTTQPTDAMDKAMKTATTQEAQKV
ncbi:putative diacylglycerol acyltransferase [Leptomonas pyrrhocoris]|uniref:Putative diacylglycerol acyltransferase n=1 Tax=Leptomonas pyrrhocoris TaxID=157538 RepID=A0A0M9G2T0_LEPPY|nr:putative diacylglycerol acyltransferase [Leptomonas pyrrhocoris]KPA80999.1 putative diacylglycerol acyltransferase [Leptomonas pyrrhocoris]|eukprot:XP_015659438.1 putative diacylglycerol acyltransferase [Leptomonas pyrrhocoris]